MLLSNTCVLRIFTKFSRRVHRGDTLRFDKSIEAI